MEKPEVTGAAATNGASQWLMVVGGVVVWIVLAWLLGLTRRQRSVRVDEPRMQLSPIPQPGFLLILASLAVWLSIPLFAGAASAMLGASRTGTGATGGGPLDIRDQSIIQIAGYLGAIGALFMFSLILPGLWRLIGASARGLPRRMSAARSVVVGMLGSVVVIPAIGVAGWALSWGAGRIALWRGEEPPPPAAHATLRELIKLNESRDPWWYATVVLVVVGAPIFEEIIYRGMLQTGLMHLTRSLWASILITSGIFTFVHIGSVSGYALPALFLLSVGFGLAMERTGRLWTSMVMHAVFNLYNVLVATL